MFDRHDFAYGFHLGFESILAHGNFSNAHFVTLRTRIDVGQRCGLFRDVVGYLVERVADRELPLSSRSGAVALSDAGSGIRGRVNSDDAYVPVRGSPQLVFERRSRHPPCGCSLEYRELWLITSLMSVRATVIDRVDSHRVEFSSERDHELS